MNGVSRLLAASGLAIAVRRGHRYVHVGHDLEANCTDEEMGNP